MSKSEEFLRTSSSGHLAVVLIRGDCVSKLQINFVKLSYSAKKTCNFETFFANFFQRLQVQSMTEVKNIKNNFVKLSYSAKKTCNFETFFANFFQRLQVQSMTEVKNIKNNFVKLSYSAKKTCNFVQTFFRDKGRYVNKLKYLQQFCCQFSLMNYLGYERLKISIAAS